MSRLLISRSPDLRQLRDEGFDLEIAGGYLLVHHVPYVTTAKEVAYGTLVSELNFANGVTVPPSPHTIRFTGTPCDADGSRLDRLINDTTRTDLGDGLVVETSFSHKPVGSGGYADYYSKITTYAAILARYVADIDPNATAKTYRVREEREDGSPFRYPDTASARAGITAITGKLAVDKVAVVGLGGTGSHVLDLIAKTPVSEIYLFDGDRMLEHNAFRGAGATSAAELDGGPNKAEHYARVYSVMRDGVVPHPYALGTSNCAELDGMQFVFLAMDPTPPKRAIIEHLETRGIPFVDTGVGVNVVNQVLGGMVRVTTGLRGRPASGHHWISFGDASAANEYAPNIQVADLNALAAALAVIRWKKLLAFYRDLEDEQQMLYTIDGNSINNERQE
jgi:hypothetical protein